MSLRVWLPLDGSLRNLGISHYDISAARGTIIYNNNGKIGKCFYANGVNVLKIGNIMPDFYNYKAYSLCAWAYVESNNIAHTGSAIISAGNWNSQLLNLALSDWSSDHYTKLRISGSNWNRTYSYNFYKNIWYHIAICDDGEYVYAYVNGQLINNSAISFLPTAIEGNNIYIGGATYATIMPFFGRINDVRIYDHCLSAAEVKEIAQGLVLHYKLDDIYSIATINQLGNKSDHFSGWGSYGFGNHGQTTIANINPALSGEVGLVTNKDNGNYDGEIATGVVGYNLNKNESITFSAYVKGNGNTIGKTGYIWIYKSNGTNTISTGTSFIFTSEWQRVKHTITWTYDNPGTSSTSCYVRCNRAQNESFYISNCQLESGSMATGFTNANREAGIIQDSSGYNHNGQMVSNINISSDTMRYNTSTLFDGVDDCIIVPYNAVCQDNIFTINLWFKKDALGSKNYETLFGGPSGFEMDTRSGSSTALSLYMASTRGGNVATGLQLNTWYMVTMVRDGINERYYINGELKKEIKAKAMPTGVYRIGAWASNTGQNYYGNISDFRIYCTVLSADDIKQLYNTPMKIDNHKNIHTFTFTENDKNKLQKYGSLDCAQIHQWPLTNFLHCDHTIYTEPDGSKWVHIFHHNNPAASKFATTDTFTTYVYKSEDQWFDVAVCDHAPQWELMVKQLSKTNLNQKYRWIQPVNPMTATHPQVAANLITRNTSSAYTQFSIGGLYKKNSNVYISSNTGGASSWWGGIGCFNNTYQGGIPGFGGVSNTDNVITTGYIDLYLRIDNLDLPVKNFDTFDWYADGYIER